MSVNRRLISAVRVLIARRGEKYMFLDAHLEEMPYGALRDLYLLLEGLIYPGGRKQIPLFPENN